VETGGAAAALPAKKLLVTPCALASHSLPDRGEKAEFAHG